MAKSIIDNISKENSLVKVDLPNVMNLFNVIVKLSLLPKSYRRHLCRDQEPNKSWWVKSKFTDLWSMLTSPSLCTFLRTVKMFTFCSSYVTTNLWTNYSKEERGFMNLKSNVTPSRSSMLLNIFILIVLFIEIWNLVIYS